MKKLFLLGTVVALLLSAGHQAFAKSRPIVTKCGKVYYIYAEMFSVEELEDLQKQLDRIDCGGESSNEKLN